MATKTMKIGLSTSDKSTMSATITAAVKANLIATYSSSATYAVGDFVYNSSDGKFYKCTTAITTAESWTSGHWTEATLNDVIAKVNQAAASVENKLDKGDYDGSTGVGYADAANNLTPYSDESGAFQDNPVISQGTGTDNNVSIVTTGNFMQLREKQGNTLAVNQLAHAITGENWGRQNGTLSISNGVATFTATAQNGYAYDGTQQYCIAGHKYLVMVDIKLTTATTSVKASVLGGYTITATETTNWQTLKRIITVDSSYNSTFSILDTRASDWDAVQFRNAIIIDLTQMFDGNIPQDLLDHPDHFSWYYNGSLAYNAGSLKNANGVKLVCTGRQLWDEEWEVGSINQDTGADVENSNVIRSKNYIRVVPNETCYFFNSTNKQHLVYFYDKDKIFIPTSPNAEYDGSFITPSNCCFIRFRMAQTYGTAYNHDITISLYYTPEEGGEGYSEHYDYEEPKVYDTGSEVLRSAGSAHDVKLPDGTIQRNVGSYTFTGNETASSWGGGVFAITGMTSVFVKGVTGNYDKPNLSISSGLDVVGYFSMGAGTNVISITSASSEYPNIIQVKLTSSSTSSEVLAFLTGKTINFELRDDRKTTEQGTPFPENIDIDDYGMMYWLDEDDELVGIPQGAKFFYPVNYKGFTDDLYNRTEGDAGNVVIQSELTASETARDAVDAQLKEALGGTLRQCLCALKTLSFENTESVVMLDLSWSYIGNGIFIATLTGATTTANTTNIISTKFKVAGSATGLSESTDIIGLNLSGYSTTNYPTIYAKIGATDLDTFKEKAKGVLLAYEKASS